MDLTQKQIDRYYDAGHEDRYETICAIMGIPYEKWLNSGYDDTNPTRKKVLDMELKMWLAMPSDKEVK